MSIMDEFTSVEDRQPLGATPGWTHQTITLQGVWMNETWLFRLERPIHPLGEWALVTAQKGTI